MKYNINCCDRYYRCRGHKAILRIIDIHAGTLESRLTVDIDSLRRDITFLSDNVIKSQYFDNAGKVVFSINQVKV